MDSDRLEEDSPVRWECLRCRSGLVAEPGGFVCRSCEFRYPIVSGIPVLTRAPRRYLQRSLLAITEECRRARIRAQQIDVVWCENALLDIGRQRLQQITRAELARLQRFLSLLEPAQAFLNRWADADLEWPDEIDVVGSGWGVEALIPYLLRDWKYDREFQVANGLISDALDQHLPTRVDASIVFAGCGAGGMLACAQNGFSRVVGLDLSLPVLVAVKELVEGRDLVLSVPTGSTEGVRIVDAVLSATRPLPTVNLLASDACETAFSSGSLDCVVTQFLLDVIPDPRSLAKEVHRILSDRGLWINYGPSGPRESLWHFDLAETTAYLETAGFTPIQMTAHRTTHLDISQLDEFASLASHVCYLSVARKVCPPKWGMAPAPKLIASNLAAIVPIHHGGAELVSRHSLEGNGCMRFLVHERIKGLPQRFEIGNGIALVLTLVDGVRTVSEIAHRLNKERPSFVINDTIAAFSRFFEAGLLTWKKPLD